MALDREQKLKILQEKLAELKALRDQQAAPKRSLVQKGWDALAVPEQKSREGLQMMANAVPSPEPTGNLALDVAKGTPRVLADTVAEAAPGFVSRSAILTAGALKGAKYAAPIVKTMARGFGKQLESASGAVPGSLEAAYKDSSLIFEKGKKAASSLYENAKSETSTNLFKGMYKPEQIVDTAQKYVSDGGKLLPKEALTARKAISSLMKSGRYVKDELISLYNYFDDIAKSSKDIAAGDVLHKRGLFAESLRQILPQNKYGGTSPFKTMILKLTGGLAAPVLSPAIQGAASTVAGVVGRNVAPIVTSPSIGVTTSAALEALARKRKRK